MSDAILSDAQLDALLIGLTVECPLSGGNPDDCAIHDLRKNPLKDRLRYVRRLSRQQKLDLYACHQECMRKKTATPE